MAILLLLRSPIIALGIVHVLLICAIRKVLVSAAINWNTYVYCKWVSTNYHHLLSETSLEFLIACFVRIPKRVKYDSRSILRIDYERNPMAHDAPPAPGNSHNIELTCMLKCDKSWSQELYTYISLTRTSGRPWHTHVPWSSSWCSACTLKPGTYTR
jgi:hypothetical protein